MAGPITLRSMALTLALTALCALAFLAVLVAIGPSWATYLPATCTETRCFCELPRSGAMVVQPANTWSSFAYVLVGFLMIVVADLRGRASAMPALASRTLGVTAIVAGLGSGLLHATLTLWGQFFDVVGMYLIGSFLLIRALTRWRRIPDGAAIILYVALCAIMIAILIGLPEVRRWLFAVLLLLAILVETVFARPLRPGARFGYYLTGLLAMAAAFGLWILDQNGVLCAPRSLLQGHAIWHALGATSLWLTFSYYRSERPSGNDRSLRKSHRGRA